MIDTKLACQLACSWVRSVQCLVYLVFTTLFWCLLLQLYIAGSKTKPLVYIDHYRQDNSHHRCKSEAVFVIQISPTIYSTSDQSQITKYSLNFKQT